MNFRSSSSSEVLFKRFRLWKRQYLHVVIYTSLFWIFLDVFFIMLFSDCTKEVIIPCSSSSLLPIKDNQINNDRKSIDDDLIRHPKFNVNKFKIANQTISDRNIINKKKIEQSKKTAGSFISKWFGSNSGWK